MPSEALVDAGLESWTCTRCEVTVQWMAGHDKPDGEGPANWSEEDGDLTCLNCRREMAAERGADNAPEGTPLAERVKLASAARVEFEINRVPDHTDGEIAKACRTSGAVVRRARERLGVPRAGLRA